MTMSTTNDSDALLVLQARPKRSVHASEMSLLANPWTLPDWVDRDKLRVDSNAIHSSILWPLSTLHMATSPLAASSLCISWSRQSRKMRKCLQRRMLQFLRRHVIVFEQLSVWTSLWQKNFSPLLNTLLTMPVMLPPLFVQYGSAEAEGYTKSIYIKRYLVQVNSSRTGTWKVAKLRREGLQQRPSPLTASSMPREPHFLSASSLPLSLFPILFFLPRFRPERRYMSAETW